MAAIDEGLAVLLGLVAIGFMRRARHRSSEDRQLRRARTLQRPAWGPTRAPKPTGMRLRISWLPEHYTKDICAVRGRDTGKKTFPVNDFR